MNSYYTIRIELSDLDSSNKKLEYRELYKELRQKGFQDSIFYDETEYRLPSGTYSIIKFDFSLVEVRNKAEDAIEAALKPYYESGYLSKYTIVVSGPSAILSRNLEPVE